MLKQFMLTGLLNSCSCASTKMPKALLHLVKMQIRGFALIAFNKNNLPHKINLYLNAISSPSKPLKNTVRRYDLVENLLSSYRNEECIPWDKIKTTIKADLKNHNSNINCIIFNSCLYTEMIDVGLSYCKHLLDSGYQLNLVETYHFLSLLKNSPADIKTNKDILLKLYDNIKPHLKLQPLLFREASQVYSHLDECWKEMLEINKCVDSDSFEFIAAAAFHNDDPELGWRELEKSPEKINQNVIKAYLNYCQKKAETGEFGPFLLNRLIKFCSQNSLLIPYDSTIYEELQKLFTIANSNDKGTHYWNVHRTKVNKNANCSFCTLQLKEVAITSKEYKILKENFLKDVFIDNNINIKSSMFELKKFLHHLKYCSPYNLVIDGLNIGFARTIKFQLKKSVLQFKNKGMEVFIIGRKSLKYIPDFKDVKNECQYFLTDNMSDDDVFSIYAAIYGGPGTYLLTSDYLRGYGDHFKDTQLKRLLRKWQISHQYRLCKTSRQIIPPLMHAAIPQLTASSDNGGSLTYHLSYSYYNTLNFSNTVNWLCVTGKLR